MIRKPNEKDFREGELVIAMRETKRVAVAAQDGVVKGGKTVARVYFYGIYWLGVLTAALPKLFTKDWWAALLLIGLAYGFQQILRYLHHATLPRKALEPHEGDFIESPATIPSKAYNMTFGGGLQTIGMSWYLAIILSIFGKITFSTFFFVPLFCAFSVGMTALVLAKAIFDPEVLSYDSHKVTINGLLGKKTLAWSRILKITERPRQWFNWFGWLTSGSHDAIIVETVDGLDVRIPVGLLCLDKTARSQIFESLVSCKSGRQIVDHGVLPDGPSSHYRPTPSSNPHESFDVDAIMARHLAEREAVVAVSRPSFGRKVA